MAIEFSGRTLTNEEENTLIGIITDNSNIVISYIFSSSLVKVLPLNSIAIRLFPIKSLASSILVFRISHKSKKSISGFKAITNLSFLPFIITADHGDWYLTDSDIQQPSAPANR